MLVVAYSGCGEKFLEEEPKGTFAATGSLKSEADAKAAVDGGYWLLGGRIGGFNDFHGVKSMHFGAANWSDNYGNIDQYQFNADDGNLNVIWEQLYRGINNVNWAIKGIGEMPQGTIFGKVQGGDGKTYSMRDKYIAEARFLRGLAYFYLANLYGEVPMPLEPYTDAVADRPRFNIPKSTSAELYTQILADLQYAADVLPVKSNYGAADKHRASSGAAKALLAKAYLYMGDFQKYFPEGGPLNPQLMDANTAYDSAMAYAKEVIESQEYDLYDDYRKNGSTFPEYEYGAEHIFAFPHDILALNDQFGARCMPPDNPVGCEDPGWRGSRRLGRPIIRTMPLDYRRWATIIYSTVRKRFYPSRFWDQKNITVQNLTSNDGPIIRFAEVLLIYADAASERFDAVTPEAAEALSRIRKRATNFFGNVQTPGKETFVGFNIYDASTGQIGNVEELRANPSEYDVEWAGFGSSFTPTGVLYFSETDKSFKDFHEGMAIDYSLVDLSVGVPMQRLPEGSTKPENLNSKRADIDYVNLYLIRAEDLQNLSIEEFRSEVFNEYDYELLWEGTRTFDWRRKRRLLELEDWGKVRDGTLTERNYVFPLPQPEIFANPLLKQAQGW